MAELTAEIVRAIVREEIKGETKEVRGEIGQLRHEMNQRFEQAREETEQGFEQVLKTVQSLHDETREALAGIKGRLNYHNERIAKLERAH